MKAFREKWRSLKCRLLLPCIEEQSSIINKSEEATLSPPKSQLEPFGNKTDEGMNSDKNKNETGNENLPTKKEQNSDTNKRDEETFSSPTKFELETAENKTKEEIFKVKRGQGTEKTKKLSSKPNNGVEPIDRTLSLATVTYLESIDKVI